MQLRPALIPLLAASLLGGVTFAVLLLRQPRESASGVIIVFALIGVFLALAWRANARRGAILLATAVILMETLAAWFGLYGWSLAGVTYDTYMHLLGGAALTALMLDWTEHEGLERPLVWAFAALAILSVGLEAVEAGAEIARSLMPNACFSSLCAYWQDTLKDFLNDTLGGLLILAAWRPRRRARP